MNQLETQNIIMIQNLVCDRYVDMMNNKKTTELFVDKSYYG